MKVKCALIGYGYWGKVLLRNLLDHQDFEVLKVVDTNINKENFSNIYPAIEVSDNLSFIFDHKELDAVIISTQATSHYKIVKEALLSDKHVLVEKPLTCSYTEALELHELAVRKNKILLVDHILMYTEAIHVLEKFISDNKNSLISISCERLNNGSGPADTNVLWDLAPHDISVINYILKELPSSVKLISSQFIDGRIGKVSAVMNYNSKKTVNISLSWKNNSQKRNTVIYCKDSTLTYDESLINDKKIKIEKFDSLSKTHRSTEYLPLVSTLSPLTRVFNDFYNSIKKAHKPLSDSVSSLHVVSIIEAINESLRNESKEIKVNYLSYADQEIFAS